MRLVVFGWGNESRGDDGLGPALLRRFQQRWPDIPAIEDYQLQIEHTLDLEGAECALFIDAGKDTPAPFSFYATEPKRETGYTTHALSPEGLLAVYRNVEQAAPPPAFTLCVRGESFELGEDLSAEAKQRLESAWDFLQDLMRAPSVEAWREHSR